MSLTDQEDMLKGAVQDNYAGKVQFQFSSTTGKGENLERDELRTIEDLVSSRKFDLVIMEDLGRYLRGYGVMPFLGLCRDYDVRAIALADHVDTARDDWEQMAGRAAGEHVGHNNRTSDRIIRSQRGRFERNGGVVQTVIYGYLKPEGCKSDQDLQKDPSAEPHVRLCADMLKAGASYSEVADMFNERGVPPGKYMRQGRWTGKAIRRWFSHPMLSGRRERNRRHSVKHHGSGRRKAVKAPPEMLLVRDVPHLAFLSVEEHDEIRKACEERNAHYKRRFVDGRDPRAGTPKKRTVWPGQHCFCSICGRMFVYGGHGQSHHLICNGSREYRCWMSKTFDGHAAGAPLRQAIFATLRTMPEFDERMHQLVAQQHAEVTADAPGQLQAVEAELQKVATAKGNLVKAIAQVGLDEEIREALEALKSQHDELLSRQADLRQRVKEQPKLPSMQAIQDAIEAAVRDLDADDQAVNRAMKKLIDKIWIEPIQVPGFGDLTLQARFVIDLSDFAQFLGGPKELPDEVAAAMRREVVVMLTRIPKHVELLPQVKAAFEETASPTLEVVAAQFKTSEKAISDAKKLMRLMEQRAMTCPFEIALAPPAEGRVRMHLHSRYAFEPRPGFPLPPFDAGGAGVMKS